jgi:hypothetical protein
MVRGPDAVDLGIWKGVPRSTLIIPLDTHVARIARCLGLTDRQDMSWRTAEEITRNLRVLDPEDPVRYDFALCHLGMSGACPPRPEAGKCACCALGTVCGRFTGIADTRSAIAGRWSLGRPGAAGPRSGEEGAARSAARVTRGASRSRPA